MKVCVVGLGRMGSRVAERLALEGHAVVGLDQAAALTEQAAGQGIQLAADRAGAAALFGKETPVIWLMIPADSVGAEIEAWLELLPAGSIIIDGGNSDYRQTITRSGEAAARGVQLVDVGVSGGILGLERGFCLMAGGPEAAYKFVAPLLKSLSQPSGSYRYFGASGSGHYVKMVHNAIEYGMMQSLAEGYRLLKEGPLQNLDLAAAAEVWQHGSIITSSLNGLVAEILSDNPGLEGVGGAVAESGEAKWALQTAAERQLGLPAIKAAYDVRLASQQGDTNFATKLLSALRNRFGGHKVG